MARLPIEYQEVKWIESHGTEYIDTGVLPNQNTGMRTVISLDNASGTQGGFGSFGTGSAQYFAYEFYVYNGTRKINAHWTNASISVTHDWGADTKYDVLLNYLNSRKLELADIGSTALTSATFSNNYPIWLGRVNYGATSFKDYKHIGKIYQVEITQDSEVIRNFIPCYRKSDGVVGMYCLVTETFFPNLGSGAFTVGADVNPTQRTFQNGVVGGTNVVEGTYISDGMEQLVNYTMLYDYGDECTDATGGWSLTYSSGGSLTKATDHLVMAGKSTSYASKVCPANKIDFTEYSMLGGKTHVVTRYSTADGCSGQGGITSTNTTASNSVMNADKLVFTGGVSYTNVLPTAEPVLYYADISDINGTYYPVLWTYNVSEVRCYSFALFKADDWSTLCKKAEITASTITEAISKATAILSNASAVSFMVKNCTGDFMFRAIVDTSFRTALASSPYKNKVYANEHWAKFLAMVA